MFSNIIEFSAPKAYLDSITKEDYPEPIKLNIPEWFKKLQHSSNHRTVKGCVPFLDSMLTGYALKLPIDFYINHNVSTKQGKDTFVRSRTYEMAEDIVEKKINLNTKAEFHPTTQLEGSPMVSKNNNQNFLKICNPWTIKTPPGYSCLFVPPLNNGDDRFSIIPGIVDTDTHEIEINFPFVINGDKYRTLETTLKKGLIYAQIIPFKRDAWKMKIKEKTEKQIFTNKFQFLINDFNIYRTKSWNKKSFK